MMIVWLMFACGDGEKLPQMSGEELIEAYHSAVCHLESDSTCAAALIDCGEPLMQRPDWASCMNDMTLITRNCGTLAAAVESRYDDVYSCLSLLENINCESDSLCASGTTIIRAEPCDLMLSLIAQECI